MNSKSCKRILLINLSVSSLYFSNTALAQTIPGGVTITSNGVIDLLQSIAGFMYIVGVVLFGIAIIYSGLAYMLAGSDASKVKGAKDALKAGLIGSAIILSVGTIVRIVGGFASNPTGFFQ